MIAIHERGFENAKPSVLLNKGLEGKHKFASKGRYTDHYVSEIHSGLTACKVNNNIYRLTNPSHTRRTAQF